MNLAWVTKNKNVPHNDVGLTTFDIFFRRPMNFELKLPLTFKEFNTQKFLI